MRIYRVKQNLVQPFTPKFFRSAVDARKHGVKVIREFYTNWWAQIREDDAEVSIDQCQIEKTDKQFIIDTLNGDDADLNPTTIEWWNPQDKWVKAGE
jgi:hypothetical protein